MSKQTDLINIPDAITVSGSNVGIGTTSPSFEGGAGTGLEIRNSSGNGAHVKLTDSASGSGGTNGFDLYAFNTSGYIENYEAGSIVFRNNGDERMRVLSGGGITFNGDTAAANALDDYETGTWTPTVASSSGTITTQSYQAGVYTKVGKAVTLHFQFIINTLGSAGGTLLVTNLPFARETSVLTYYGGFWRARSGTSSIAEINPSNTCYLYGASPIVSTYYGSLFYKTA